MTVRKIIKLTIIVFIALTIKSTVCGKYVIEYVEKVAEIEIIQPQFKAEIIEIQNVNEKNKKYTNKQHEIQIKVRVDGKNGIINNFQKFELLVGREQSQCIKEIKILESDKNYIIYNIIISNIAGNGPLILKLPDNSFKDMIGNKMSEMELDVGIEIDNISQETKSEQELLDKKTKTDITVDEKNIDINCNKVENVKQDNSISNNIADEEKYNVNENEMIEK